MIRKIVLRHTEYDIYNCVTLAEELDGMQDAPCIVDFQHVRYIDSTCLGALIRTLKKLRLNDPGATMTLVNLNPQLRRLFEITKLTALFAIA